MKFNFKPLMFALTAAFTFNCSSDDSTDPITPSVEKFIQKIEVVSAQDPLENAELTISYDTDGKVISASDGESSKVFVYENGSLVNITGSGSSLDVLDVTSTTHDAYELGSVDQYDNNGNPYKLTLLQEEYDYENNTYTMVEYAAELSYDNKPNPYYHTLDAAGVIDALDDVELNFSSDVQNPMLLQAKLLLPVNNPKGIIIKNPEGQIVASANTSYVYDSDDYPTSATVTTTNEENESSTFTATYTYL